MKNSLTNFNLSIKKKIGKSLQVKEFQIWI